MATKLITIPEAAERLGITPSRVWQIVQERGLGQRIGRMYVLSPEDLRSLRKRRHVGRPRLKRPKS